MSSGTGSLTILGEAIRGGDATTKDLEDSKGKDSDSDSDSDDSSNIVPCPVVIDIFLPLGVVTLIVLRHPCSDPSAGVISFEVSKLSLYRTVWMSEELSSLYVGSSFSRPNSNPMTLKSKHGGAFSLWTGVGISSM